VLIKSLPHIVLTLLVFTSISPSVFAMDREVLYGKWGTTAQCAESLIVENGTKRATPFDIRPDWLELGNVWCRLDWVYSKITSAGTFAVTRALCGEDSARDYQISFNLVGDELTLVWDERVKNGPLMRCP